MQTLTKTGVQKKEKVTVSIDAELLQVIDAYVEEGKESGLSRSSAFEQALLLWKQEMRDQFDAEYYSRNQKQLRDDSWTAITTEAAKTTWGD